MSGLQPGGRPGAGPEGAAARGRQAARPPGTVVDARLAFHPQLHPIGPQPIATPVRRARDGDLHGIVGAGTAGSGRTVSSRHGGDGAEQPRARVDWLALRTRPGAHTALPGARGEVAVAVRRGCLHDLPLDAHLPMQGVPVHDRRRARVVLQLPASRWTATTGTATGTTPSARNPRARPAAPRP